MIYFTSIALIGDSQFEELCFNFGIELDEVVCLKP